MALTPGPPPKADSLVAAIREYGASLAARAPDSSRRRGERHPEPRPAAPRSRVRSRRWTIRMTRSPSVVASLLDLGTSYLAVQGPPGTGKTYVGARVIRDLVQKHRWRIGVVAQSHARRRERARRDRARRARPATRRQGAGERARSPGSTRQPVHRVAAGRAPRFAAEHRDRGYVIGGTSWDFTNLKRVEPRPARPARHRGGGPVLAREHHRGGRRGEAPSASRRPAAASAGEPGHPPRAGRRLRARLTSGGGTTCSRPSSGTSSPRAAGWMPRSPRRCRDSRTTGELRSHREHPGSLARRHRARGCIRSPSTTATTRRRPTRRPRGSSRLGASASRLSLDRTRPRSPTTRRSASATSSSSTPYNAQVETIRRRLDEAGSRRHPRRHRRQVPGPGGRHLDREPRRVESRRRTARALVPALPQPPQRGDLAGAVGGLPGLLAAADRAPAEHARRHRRAEPIHRVGRRPAGAIAETRVGARPYAGSMTDDFRLAPVDQALRRSPRRIRTPCRPRRHEGHHLR